ncbi:MAG: HlyD family efflux transporter periplasmic adaptor subunit, partial [Mizugakiibacter sp.]|uniref:HlyD family efflux transporter periplasmic adaptor subunit n=1 Tax=Mizugakiibacter sp. TaxID=1972610 RepID=UPI00320EC515
ARLAAARAALALRTLRAPVAGRIARRAVQPGATVSAQSAQALFELLPDRPRIVRAELNEAFVAAVHPGMRAEVTVDGDDPRATVVPAQVLRVGLVFGPSRLADDAAQDSDARAVDCVLALQRDPGLRIGQRVLVRILPDATPTPR